MIRPGYRISHLHREIRTFIFHEPHRYNQYITIYDVLFSHMTVTGSSLRRSTRRFASRLSRPLAKSV